MVGWCRTGSAVFRGTGDAMNHVLYTPADFTAEEIDRRNRLAVVVIDGGLSICKICGAAESELQDWLTCEKYRKRHQCSFSSSSLVGGPAHSAIFHCNECGEEWEKDVS